MKPQLYSIAAKEGEFHAVLVDTHSVFMSADETGKMRPHYGAAILMHRFHVGEFYMDDDNVIIYPSPCVLQVHREMKPVGLEARGLSLAAAEVLLVLAASRNKASTKQAVKGNPWSFGNPYDKDAEIVWCQWKFIAAWMWCSWMKGGEKPPSNTGT